jgi:glyoxylase-like metal-dependent hydrolase (beta-lactamase superfamily II)
VLFKQFYLNCLAHASYLIGDEATGTGAVVDPQRDIEQYLVFAAEHNLQIKHVFLTHLHADFVAGHLELGIAWAQRFTLVPKRRRNTGSRRSETAMLSSSEVCD